MYQVIGRGFNGWHAEGLGASSSGGALEYYLADATEGALVYDASEADYDAFSRFVITGPMLNLSLEPFETRPFDGHDSLILEASGLKELAALGGLDYAGIGLYETLLRQVPGLKVGWVNDGNVFWERSGVAIPDRGPARV